ncbi:MAG TPA: acyl-CoA dehydrogenase family protein [Usitatibacter sp.]|nr:acyl-CoA dehydrogenase family protein [Usitatibacter sp.]
MNDRDISSDLLSESVARMLADVVSPRRTIEAEALGIDAAASQALSDLGLAGDDAAAIGIAEQAAVVEALGHAGALVPYADAVAMARWLALEAGFRVAPEESLALLVNAAGAPIVGRRVPWGRHCARTLLAFSEGGRHFVAIAETAALRLENGANVAGEPRDKCRASPDAREVREVGEALAPDAVMRRGALLRTAAMIGAARRIQELTLVYAGDRKQFGKPLAQFQVIQSYLAQMAGEVTAATAMYLAAREAAAASGAQAALEIAAAKVRAGLAAQVVSALAHQVHGAIGFTQEYPLHLWTRRLWSWREEFGNETHWSRMLGSQVVALGADNYWERITA